MPSLHTNNKKITIELNEKLEVEKTSFDKSYLESVTDTGNIWLLEAILEEEVREKILNILMLVDEKTNDITDLKEFLKSRINELKMYDYNQILKAVGSEELAKKEYERLLKIRKDYPISTQEFISYEIDPIYTNEIDNPRLI